MMKYFIILAFLVIIFSCSKNSENKDISNPEVEIILDYQIIRPSGYGINDGQIKKTITGGTPPYTVTWSKEEYPYGDIYSVDENQDLVDASAGPYIIRVTDSIDNIKYDTVFLASNDTIISSPYICAYPGSYWIYDNGAEIQCNGYFQTPLYWEYEYESVLYSPDGCPYPRDSVYLPNAGGLIWDNYKMHNYSSSCSWASPNYFTIIVSEELNNTWDNGDRNSGSKIRVVAIDSSIILDNVTYENVIIMESRWGAPSTDFEDMIPDKKFYYAKDIGFIKEENFSDPENSFEIIDYHINFSN